MSFSVIQCPVKAGTEDGPASIIDALARTMSARDGFTHEHARRVQRYAVALAGEANIRDHRMLEAIDGAALLHDIGKLGIPDQLLHKPGPLTPAEYDQVKQHAIIGADILSAVSLAGPLALIVRHHHENWDGTGYPDGLRGDAIPLGARVLAIVDCYDALTSDRPVPPVAFARPCDRDDSSSGAARCTNRISRTRSFGLSTSCDKPPIGIAPAQRPSGRSDRDGWRG